MKKSAGGVVSGAQTGLLCEICSEHPLHRAAHSAPEAVPSPAPCSETAQCGLDGNLICTFVDQNMCKWSAALIR